MSNGAFSARLITGLLAYFGIVFVEQYFIDLYKISSRSPIIECIGNFRY